MTEPSMMPIRLLYSSGEAFAASLPQWGIFQDIVAV